MDTHNALITIIFNYNRQALIKQLYTRPGIVRILHIGYKACMVYNYVCLRHVAVGIPCKLNP